MPTPTPPPTLFPGYPIFKLVIFFLSLAFLVIIAMGVILLGVRICLKLTFVDYAARRTRTRSRSPRFWRRFVPDRQAYGNFEDGEEPDSWAEDVERGWTLRTVDAWRGRVGRGRALRRVDAWRGRVGRGRALRRMEPVLEEEEIELEEIEAPTPLRRVTLRDEPGEIV